MIALTQLREVRFDRFGPRSVSVDPSLPFLRLTAALFGIEVRFRRFGCRTIGKAVTFLGLSEAIIES